MRLTFHMPGFLLPGDAFADTTYDLSVPALSALLAYGCRQPWQGPSLPRLFGISHWPAAALRRHAAGLSCAGQWLCLDPVHFHVRRDGVFLCDPAELALNDDEAARLIAAIAPLFAPWGSLSASRPEHWELELREPPPPFLLALPERIGQRVPAGYPAGEAATPWRVALAEAQTVLHAHPVNRQREQQGRATVMSVWPWGAGALPEAVAADYTTVASEDETIAGYCRCLHIAHRPPPRRFIVDAGHWLVHLQDLVAPALRLDALAWRAALTRLEEDWFAPILQALRRARLRSFTLIATDGAEREGFTLTLTPWQAWRYWRRPCSLAELR